MALFCRDCFGWGNASRSRVPFSDSGLPQKSEVELDIPFVKKEFQRNSSRLLYSEGIYFGQLNRDGLRHGYGIFITMSYTYCGQWCNDQRDGLGTWGYNAPSSSITAGPWKNDVNSGRGIEVKCRESADAIFSSANTHHQERNYSDYEYEGGLENGKWDGYGQVKYANGEAYIGHFREGLYHGTGTLTTTTGKILEGTFTNGQWDGTWYGTQTNPRGDTATGHWFLNQLNGPAGKIVRANGDVEEGLFLNGRLNGPGRCYTAASGDEYTGHFLHGLKWGEGTMKRGGGGGGAAAAAAAAAADSGSVVVIETGVWFNNKLVT